MPSSKHPYPERRSRQAQRAPQPAKKRSGIEEQQPIRFSAGTQRTSFHPDTVTANDVIGLRPTIGNRLTSQLLKRVDQRQVELSNKRSPTIALKQDTEAENSTALAFVIKMNDGRSAARFHTCDGLTFDEAGGAGHITFRRGSVEPTLWAWIQQLMRDGSKAVQRKRFSILFVPEGGEAVQRWMVHDAFPTRVELPQEPADEGEVAVETLEIAYEAINWSNSG